MKKKLVSCLIAGVLFFSNIGATPFVIDKAFALTTDEMDEVLGEDVSLGEDYTSSEDNTENTLTTLEENKYVKIYKFTELPEDVLYQEVKAGTKIEDISFPDTLEIHVIPDDDKEEREKKIKEEQEKVIKAAVEASKEASSEASSDASLIGESDDASSSFSSDEEEIIFFNSEEEISSDNSSEGSGQQETPSVETGSVTPENKVDTSETTTSVVNEPVAEPVNGDAPSDDAVDVNTNNASGEKVIIEEDESPAEPTVNTGEENTQESSVESGESTEAGTIIGKIMSAFSAGKVYAAEEEEAGDDAVGDNLDSTVDNDEILEDGETSEDYETSENVSIEQVSDVKWILKYDENDITEFNSDLVGMEYEFIPVLLIPDFYYIEAELPTITVKIVEDNFEFDSTAELDGVKIRVRADKGVFPEGSVIKAAILEDEEEKKVADAISEQSEDIGFVVKSYSFDISVVNEDGEEIEPDTTKGRVIVSFEAKEAEDENLTAEVYHIKEDEAASEETSEENKESDTSASEDLTVEKLQAVVVDGEESKAVEAVTDGFSKYTLTFKVDAIETTIEDQAYICLEKLISDKLSVDISNISVSEVESANDEYFYFEELELDTPADSYSPKVGDDGCYISADNDGACFLIVRKPFVGQTKTFKVTFTKQDSSESETSNLEITIKNDSWTNGSLKNNAYPYAIALGENKFTLAVDTDSDADGLTYQWQYRTGTNGTWNNIDLANSKKFGGDFGDSLTYKKNDWYRCLVNGTESKPVQIISKASDTSRAWTASYNSDDQSYVGNGTLAYTFSGDLSTGITIDVVGQFAKNGTPYMMQTTAGGTGWKLQSSSDASPGATDWAADSNLEALYFSFDDSNLQQLNVVADLADTQQAFAIGNNCAVGNTTQSAYPVNGTIFANTDGNNNTSKVSFMATQDKEAAHAAVNTGKGAEYPAWAAVPVTSTALSYISSADNQKAFASSTSRVLSGSPSGFTLSWTNLTAGSRVEFNIAVGSVATVTDLQNVKKATYTFSSSGVSTSIKDAKLVGSEFLAFANAVGNPSDEVHEKMTLKTTSSGKSALASRVKSYGSSTVAYKADYLDVTVNQTKNGSTTEVTEVKKDGSDLPLKIEVTYDFSEKSKIKVLREHSGTVKEFTESDSGKDGTYTMDKDAGKIYIYANKFSQYAIAYQEDVYYTVTFDNGTSTSQVKVKSGEKVSKPSPDPTKEGYTFKGWYLSGSSTKSTSTASSSSTVANAASSVVAGAYNFDLPVTRDIKLIAGWTVIKAETTQKTNDSDNESRAPKTGDNLPIVWLWILILLVSAATFVLSLKELINAGKGEIPPRKMTPFRKTLLLIGIIISTTAKFVVKKIKQNKQKVLLTTSGAVVIISVIVLTSTLLQYQKAKSLYTDAEKMFTAETETLSETDKDAGEAEEAFNWWDCVDVNVAELSEKYPDVVGWIYFENEDISYPIMYSGDNSKYLTTAYTGEKARAGAIFMDCESTPDFSDPHSLIYGHNMRDLSMFGRLRYYKTDKDYYDEHQYFQIFTKTNVYRYRIFAYEEVYDNDDVFWTYGKQPKEYFSMLKEVEKRSLVNTGITTDESDHVITLSTCTSEDDKRLIVCAVRTDAYTYEQ